MSETSQVTQRPDVDIESDIDHLISHYPPLVFDRRGIHVSSHDGVITVTGHVQTPSTRRYFLDHLMDINGVVAVNAERFYDDQSIRLDIARVLPNGVQVARIRQGVIVLTGEPPGEMTLQDAIEIVSKVPGVVQVVGGFGG